MLRIHLILSLFLLTTFRSSFCMEELPLQPMHSPEEVIQKFNNTIVMYAAATQYLTGPEYAVYSSDPWVGFVSPRISYDQQPLVSATHSIKKLINALDFYGKDWRESLLTDWSVYEGNLKMRAATVHEVEAICKQWCPNNYDFDYANWANIKYIAINYCAGCP